MILSSSMFRLPRLFQTVLVSSRKGLLSNSQVFCRKCSVKNPGDDKRESNSAEGFETVYKLPLIRFLSAFNRLKIYHAFATFTAIPISFILASQGILDPEFPVVTTYIGIFYILL